jgi:uncharacterized membrane protein YphA (DoxX/SURF4 family)
MNTAGQLVAAACELTVEAVLITAGAAKIADRAGFANTLVELGVPARRERLLAIAAAVIPMLEIALGITTVIRFQAKFASLGLLFAASLFTLLTLWAMRRRPKVRCRCFGDLGAAAFGRRTLGRNAILVALAAVAVWYEWGFEPAISMTLAMRLLSGLSFAAFAIAVGHAAWLLPSLRPPTEVTR